MKENGQSSFTKETTLPKWMLSCWKIPTVGHPIFRLKTRIVSMTCGRHFGAVMSEPLRNILAFSASHLLLCDQGHASFNRVSPVIAPLQQGDKTCRKAYSIA